ncbi:MAG: hypothetical protein ABIQ35_00485 [Verrucomicrobiota bacterium]
MADELRDADPLPCEVCDSMPHRMRKLQREAAEIYSTTWDETDGARIFITTGVAP